MPSPFSAAPVSSVTQCLVACLALLGGTASLEAEVASFGHATTFDEGWRFHLGDVDGGAVPGLDDSTWRVLDLPHDWSVEAQASPDNASCQGYLPGGIGWYRKTFSYDTKAATGEQVYLYFEGVYNRSQVYLNGHLLGERPNGYVSFLYDATPYLRTDAPNTVAVRVDHSRAADSRWYTGSGIYRPVWMISAQAVHLAPWGIFAYPTELSEEAATVMVESEVQNTTDATVELIVRHQLTAPDGQIVAEHHASVTVAAKAKGQTTQKLAVKHPQLWSLAHPHLYTVKTTVELDGQVIDETRTRTGIREFTFDANKGFALNGEPMKLKGVCVHHDAGVLGAAVPPAFWRERLTTLKRMGVNAIRTSHNPQATVFYDLCDELGLLVLNEAYDEWEFPKRKWLEGWNVGTPGYEGSYDFFAEWGERDLADMVRRDRNHPSIFTWSIGNEVDYPNDPYSHPVLNGSAISQPMYGGYDPERPNAERLGAIAERLAKVVRSLDTSRPVTAALAGVVMSNETAYPGALDIVGYNYTEDRYAKDHALYPERILYGSETRHDYAAWQAVAQNDFVMGQFIWTGLDYLGEAGRWPSRGLNTGMIDFAGFIKPQGHYRAALWAEEPVIYLGAIPASEGDWQSIYAMPFWNFTPGQRIRVHSYTNAHTVELFLNGQPVGEARSPRADSGIITWDVPFAPGKLEAVGRNAAGEEICRTLLPTPGQSERLELEVVQGELNRPRAVAMITATVVDAEGYRVVEAKPEVTVEVDGPARLLGLEAGNNEDMGDYSDNRQHAHLGRLLAYVQASGEPGEVVVRFSTDGLPAAEVRLSVSAGK